MHHFAIHVGRPSRVENCCYKTVHYCITTTNDDEFTTTTPLSTMHFTYTTYRRYIDQQMADLLRTGCWKMKPYIQKNVQLMQHHDHIYRVCAPLHTALSAAPAPLPGWYPQKSWCGDAAFNIPLMAAAEALLVKLSAPAVARSFQTWWMHILLMADVLF